MRLARPRLRRAVGSLVAATVTAWSLPVTATDKAACVDAAEAGQRLRNEGRLISARDRLLICASPECPEVVSQDCTGWLGEVQRRLASVVVRARDTNGASLGDVAVSLDGAMLTERAPTAAIELDPGDHVFRCERAGFEAAQQRVRLSEGERGREITCQLTPLVPPPEAPTEPPAPVETTTPTTTAPSIPWTVWALGGLGVAGIGGFAAFGLWGKSDENTAKTTCRPYCSQASVDSIQTKYVIADISLGVGVVALGAAVVIGLLHASASSPPSSGQRTAQGRDVADWAQFPPARQNPKEQVPQHWPVVEQAASATRHGTQVLVEPQYVPRQQSLEFMQLPFGGVHIETHLRAALIESPAQHPLSLSAPALPQQLVPLPVHE